MPPNGSRYSMLPPASAVSPAGARNMLVNSLAVRAVADMDDWVSDRVEETWRRGEASLQLMSAKQREASRALAQDVHALAARQQILEASSAELRSRIADILQMIDDVPFRPPQPKTRLQLAELLV